MIFATFPFVFEPFYDAFNCCFLVAHKALQQSSSICSLLQFRAYDLEKVSHWVGNCLQMLARVFLGNAETGRSRLRLWGQDAEDRRSRNLSQCTWLVKEMFSLYFWLPGCHISLLICSSAPPSSPTSGWQLDVPQMLCELVSECHQVWILALLMALKRSKVSRYISFSWQEFFSAEVGFHWSLMVKVSLGGWLAGMYFISPTRVWIYALSGLALVGNLSFK